MENFIKVQLTDGESNCGEFLLGTGPAGLALDVVSEWSKWVLVFPRQMSQRGEELCVFSVWEVLLLPSSMVAYG